MTTRKLIVLVLFAGIAASFVMGVRALRPQLREKATRTDETAGPTVAPAAPSATASVADLSRPPNLPDTPLIDQRGEPMRFYSDLARGRVVAISFLFTTCKGVCPPIGANLGKLARDPRNRDVRFVSVSVDPTNDTPARLARWSEAFGSSPNWTLVTGKKQDVDGLLKALGVFSVDKVNHSPQILIGNDRTATWRRVGGLSGAEAIQEAIDSLAGTPPRKGAEIAADSLALRYFTDVVLIDQYGERRRLYSDLLHDKTVVIQVFFASCKNTCPQIVATFQKLQDHIGDRLGREVHLISLTVDPEQDDVQAIAEHARRVGARPGWYLLTGPKENVAFALDKLGMAVLRREEHSNIFLIGNVATGLWKKVRGLDRADAIADILDGVTADTGEPKAPAGAGG